MIVRQPQQLLPKHAHVVHLVYRLVRTAARVFDSLREGTVSARGARRAHFCSFHSQYL